MRYLFGYDNVANLVRVLKIISFRTKLVIIIRFYWSEAVRSEEVRWGRDCFENSKPNNSFSRTSNHVAGSYASNGRVA